MPQASRFARAGMSQVRCPYSLRVNRRNPFPINSAGERCRAHVPAAISKYRGRRFRFGVRGSLLARLLRCAPNEPAHESRAAMSRAFVDRVPKCYRSATRTRTINHLAPASRGFYLFFPAKGACYIARQVNIVVNQLHALETPIGGLRIG